MADPQLLVRFDDFGGGEFGAQGATLAEKNQWFGLNALPHADGGISPRPGTRLYSPTGTTQAQIALLQYDALGSRWFYLDDTRRFHSIAHPPSGAETDSAVVAGVDPTTVACDGVFDGSQWYVTVSGDGVYTFDGTTAAALAGTPPAGNAIAIYKERMVIGGDGSAKYGTASGRRIGYSAADNFTSWPATNFFDVGRPGDSIRSLISTRDSLIVQMAAGDVYVVTGTLGSTYVVRAVTEPNYFRNRASFTRAQHFALTEGGTIVRHQPNEYAAPEVFAGGRFVTERFMEGWVDGWPPWYEGWEIFNDEPGLFDVNRFAIVAGPGDDDYCVFAQNATGTDIFALLYRNGAFSRHVLQHAAINDGPDVMCVGSHPRGFLIPVYRTASKEFLFWEVGDFETQDYNNLMVSEDSGSAEVHAKFLTPLFRDRSGREMQVTSIVVVWTHLADWGAGVAELVVAPVATEIMGYSEPATVEDAEPVAKIAVTGLTTGSRRHRRRIGFQTPWAGAYRVALDVRNLRIHAIEVWGVYAPGQVP